MPQNGHVELAHLRRCRVSQHEVNLPVDRGGTLDTPTVEDPDMADIDVTPARIDGEEVIASDDHRGPLALRRRSSSGRVPTLTDRRHRPSGRPSRSNAIAPAPRLRTSAPRSSTAPPSCWRRASRSSRRSISAGVGQADLDGAASRRPEPSTPSASPLPSPAPFTGEMVPLDASSAGVGKLGFVKRVPIGVVGAISPFNFPLNLVCHKIAPAVAAGCPVVLEAGVRHSPHRVADRRAVRGGRPAAGLAERRDLLRARSPTASSMHDDVAMITFTGSPEVGWGIRARAPHKRVSLELGNNAPVIIEPDGDWETAAAKIAVAGYSFAGQSCISVQRVFVHHAVHDGFLAALAEQGRSAGRGRPRSTTPRRSRRSSPRRRPTRVKDWIDEAASDGARGDGRRHDRRRRRARPDGARRRRARHAGQPHRGLRAGRRHPDATRSFDDALALANDTRYGLQAGVFTSNLGKALQAGDALDFGGVIVNEVPTWRADQMPYGGVRDSGNTREGPAYTVAGDDRAPPVVFQP